MGHAGGQAVQSSEQALWGPELSFIAAQVVPARSLTVPQPYGKFSTPGRVPPALPLMHKSDSSLVTRLNIRLEGGGRKCTLPCTRPQPGAAPTQGGREKARSGGFIPHSCLKPGVISPNHALFSAFGAAEEGGGETHPLVQHWTLSHGLPGRRGRKPAEAFPLTHLSQEPRASWELRAWPGNSPLAPGWVPAEEDVGVGKTPWPSTRP